MWNKHAVFTHVPVAAKAGHVCLSKHATTRRVLNTSHTRDEEGGTVEDRRYLAQGRVQVPGWRVPASGWGVQALLPSDGTPLPATELSPGGCTYVTHRENEERGQAAAAGV